MTECNECNGVGYTLIADKNGDIVNAEPCGCECPACEGSNLNEDATKCWDCDGEA